MAVQVAEHLVQHNVQLIQTALDLPGQNEGLLLFVETWTKDGPEIPEGVLGRGERRMHIVINSLSRYAYFYGFCQET